LHVDDKSNYQFTRELHNHRFYRPIINSMGWWTLTGNYFDNKNESKLKWFRENKIIGMIN
jgi:hypothetical protein